MANLLDMIDKLLGNVLQGNFYTDRSDFSQKVTKMPTPDSAYAGIPSTDPRLLDLRSPAGFSHPHKEVSMTENRRVIPPDPMHDAMQLYNGADGTIVGAKRHQIYQGTPPGAVPPQVGAQTTLSSQIKRMSRPEMYQGTPPQSPAQVAQTSINRPLVNMIQAEIYQPGGSVPPNTSAQQTMLAAESGILSGLADFHQRKSITPVVSAPVANSPTAFANKETANVNFPIKTPDKNPPSNYTAKNEFVGVPPRPLSFRGGQDAPARTVLAASTHAMSTDSNASAAVVPQRHGMIEDNLYDNTNTPFQGNFVSVFRGSVPQPLNYANIFAAGHWLRNIATELFMPLPDGTGPDATGTPVPERITKGITFAASQLLLASFNPANPENGISNAIYNPLSILASIPFVAGSPYAGDVTNITVGAATGAGNYKDNVLALEKAGTPRLKLMRKGAYSEASPIHRASKLYFPISQLGFIGDTVGPGPGDTLDNQQRDQLPNGKSTIQIQVDGGSETELVIKQGVHTNLYTSAPARSYDQQSAIVPLEKMLDNARGGALDPAADKLADMFDAVSRASNSIFSANSLTGTPPLADWKTKSRVGKKDGFSAVSMADAPGLNAAVVDASLFGETEDAVVEYDPIDPDLIYMDLMFQDLRDPVDTFLYFRAFLKGDLNETFTPDWQQERYYGRVDQVPIYKGTIRTLNFTFDVVAFSPKDLPIIWKKLKKLQSMVYPTYDLAGFMAQGPLTRLKIGDLIAGSNGRGLPGYITGMDWSFPDGIWNIETNWKVPRLVSVAISYTVIHDGNPGIYPHTSWALDTASGGTNDVIENTDVGERTFGTAKFTSDTVSTNVTVSSAEIRRIFDPVKND